MEKLKFYSDKASIEIPYPHIVKIKKDSNLN